MRYVKSEPVYTLRWLDKNSWSDEKDKQFWNRAREMLIKGIIHENEESFMDRGEVLRRMGQLMQEGINIAVIDTQETFLNATQQEDSDGPVGSKEGIHTDGSKS